jgi:serine/threonine protein kinase
VPQLKKYYLIFEYCDKKTVYELIKKKEESGLPLIIVFSIYYQFISALKSLSHQGVCHRDLKNENLLLNSKGEIKIIDFDLAISPRTEKEDKLVIENLNYLTKEYISPDLGSSMNKDWKKYDIWCAGLILFEIQAINRCQIKRILSAGVYPNKPELTSIERGIKEVGRE